MRKSTHVFFVLMVMFLHGDIKADVLDSDNFTSYPSLSFDALTGTRFQYTSGSGKDRCTVSHCLCRVNPDPPRLANMTRPVERRLSVYFSEGGSTLSEQQARQVQQFVETQASSSFTVVGYTDACGTHEYNRSLAQARVTSVKGLLRLPSPYQRIDGTVFNAEHGSGHDPSVRRVDIIAHTTSRLTTMVDKIQADVYLIDASGSMWGGWKNWVDVVAVSFRPGARVYLSKTTSCTEGQRLSEVRPAGGTEIWYSYWKILEWMNPGETLAIVSDFRSDVPLTRRESMIIEQKVRERNINVIAISP